VSTETIKEFLVGLGFQVDEKSLGKFNTGIMKSGVAVVALGQLAADAAKQVAAAVTELLNVNRYAEELEKINDVSERTKVAAEDIFRMGYQAEQTGSDMGALTSSLTTLTTNAGLAAIGMGRAKKVFEEIGLDVKDSNGELKETTVLMEEIRQKIKGMASGQQQAILSRLGIDPTLIKMMTEDMSGLTAEYDEMVRASGFSANQAVKDADNYRDELAKLQTAMGLIGKTVSSKLFNKLSESTERLRKLIVSNMPQIIAAISKVIEEVLYVGKIFVTIGARIFNVVYGVIEMISKLNDYMDGWVVKIGLAVLAWRAFNLAFFATPIGQVVALATAIALLAEDFYVWTQGGETLINWDKWKPGIDLVMNAVYELKDMFTALFTTIFAYVDFIVKLLHGDFAGAWFAIKEVVMGVIEAISRALGFVASIGKIGSTFLGAATSDAGLLTPSPAAAASLGGANQNVTQKTDIIVQGSADPAATGRAVAGEQGRVNADMTRNLAPRAR